MRKRDEHQLVIVQILVTYSKLVQRFRYAMVRKRSVTEHAYIGLYIVERLQIYDHVYVLVHDADKIPYRIDTLWL